MILDQVFAFERQSEGGWYRSFAAGSYPAFWSRYQSTRLQDRHFYEASMRKGKVIQSLLFVLPPISTPSLQIQQGFRGFEPPLPRATQRDLWVSFRNRPKLELLKLLIYICYCR